MSKKLYFTEEERKAAHRAESAKYRQANREELKEFNAGLKKQYKKLKAEEKNNKK